MTSRQTRLRVAGGGGRSSGGAGGLRGAAGTTDAAQISAWVVANFRSSTVGGKTVYTPSPGESKQDTTK